MSTLRKVGTCTVIAPTGARYVFRSSIGWTSGMCLRIDRARRLIALEFSGRKIRPEPRKDQ